MGGLVGLSLIIGYASYPFAQAFTHLLAWDSGARGSVSMDPGLFGVCTWSWVGAVVRLIESLRVRDPDGSTTGGGGRGVSGSSDTF